MGFSATLLLAHRYERETCTVWEVEDMINFGRIERAEEGQPPPKGRALAASCCMSALYMRLIAKCREAIMTDFAPPFEQGDKRRKDGEFVRPFLRIPYAETILAHNQALKHHRLLTKVRQGSHEFLLNPPLLWESCEMVGWWLDDLSSQESYGGKLLSKDATGLAYRRAWRAFLREMAVVEAKVILVFDSSADHALI